MLVGFLEWLYFQHVFLALKSRMKLVFVLLLLISSGIIEQGESSHGRTSHAHRRRRASSVSNSTNPQPSYPPLLATSAAPALADHLAQLPLFGEFAAEDAEIVDEVTAALDEGGARGNGTVGLDAEFEFAVGEGRGRG